MTLTFKKHLFFGCSGSLLLSSGFLQLWRWRRGARSPDEACWLLIAVAFLVAEKGSRRVGPLAVVHGGSAAQQDLPGPGMEPVSPASAGGFLSAVSLGKSPY